MRVLVFDRMEECTEAEVQRMLRLVSKQRREQALRYKHLLGQYCCLKSWLMLQEMIGEVGEFSYTSYGKPYIEGGKWFSISHCKEGIAIAVDDSPIGIDIESIRHAEEELVRRVMSAAEYNEIESAMRDGGEGDRLFTLKWTQKEAVLKAEGVGIQSFEQLQTISEKRRYWKVESIEKANYIYSIAYGKLHCFSA